MAWAKFDDRWDDHRKIKLAWHRSRAAVAIHAMAITYSARHETDGFIDEVWLLERMPDQGERDEAVKALVEVGLFNEAEQGYWVNDFLEYNPSRADAEERRRKDAERKARGRTSGRRSGQESESAGNPSGLHADSHDHVRGASARPDPTRPDPTPTTDAADARERDAIEEWPEVEQALRQVPEWSNALDRGASVACLSLVQASRDVPWVQIASTAAASRLDVDAGLRTDSPRQALDMQLADHRAGRSTGAGERGRPPRRQQRSSLDHYRDMAAEFAAEEAGVTS